MKIHIQKSKTDNSAACARKFNNNFRSRNYETVTIERFGELLEQQPGVCCERCKIKYNERK